MMEKDQRKLNLKRKNDKKSLKKSGRLSEICQLWRQRRDFFPRKLVRNKLIWENVQCIYIRLMCDMLNTVKSVLADILSVSPSSEQRRRANMLEIYSNFFCTYISVCLYVWVFGFFFFFRLNFFWSFPIIWQTYPGLLEYPLSHHAFVMSCPKTRLQGKS